MTEIEIMKLRDAYQKVWDANFYERAMITCKHPEAFTIRLHLIRIFGLKLLERKVLVCPECKRLGVTIGEYV